MSSGARLSMPDARGGARHPVDYTASAEQRQVDGELQLHVVNISVQGFMIHGEVPLERGERLEVRFPLIGRIEAHLVWSHEGRAGFQFERLIRADEFLKLVDALQPNPRLHPRR